MDERLQVRDLPRPDVADGVGDIPLVTLAWRALRREHKSRAEEQTHLQNALLEIALEVHRLRCHCKAMAARSDDKLMTSLVEALEKTADHIEGSLNEIGVTIVDPESEPYTHHLMEMLENIAQVPKTDIDELIVAEVVSPAILYREELLQRGKAIIGVPVRPSEAKLANAGEVDGKSDISWTDKERENAPLCARKDVLLTE